MSVFTGERTSKSHRAIIDREKMQCYNVSMAQLINFKQRTQKTPRKNFQRTSKGAALGKAPLAKLVREVDEWYSTASGESDLRDRAAFLILSRIGMRASELVALKLSDFKVDDDGFLIQFKRPKTRDVHTVRLPDAVHDRIMSAIKAYHEKAVIDDDHIFFSLPNHLRNDARTHLTTRSLQRMVNRWGLVDGSGKVIAPHGMRHFVGIQASKLHGFIHAQKLLGHSDPKTTSLYYTDPSVTSLDF